MKLEGKHVMVDLETLGTASNSVIISLGAAEFNETGITSTFYRRIDAKSCVLNGLVIDVDTVMWWMQQSAEARIEFTKGGENLYDVLQDFHAWFPKDACLWGNGAAFDNVLLSSAYKATGLDQPWKFWNDRCYRTMKNMYPDVKADPFIGAQHHALDDALHQARHLIKIAKAQQ